MDKLYIFYNIDITLSELISKSEGKIKIKNSCTETSIKYKNSEIILINENGTSSFDDDTNLWGFFVTTHDWEILRYLFLKYKIMFFEIDVFNYVSYLDPIKHKKYITNTINNYVFETMLSKGIINNLRELENHIGITTPFFNEYIIEKGQMIRYKIVRKEYFKFKIKNFFKKIYVKFFSFKKK